MATVKRTVRTNASFSVRSAESRNSGARIKLRTRVGTQRARRAAPVRPRRCARAEDGRLVLPASSQLDRRLHAMDGRELAGDGAPHNDVDRLPGASLTRLCDDGPAVSRPGISASSAAA